MRGTHADCHAYARACATPHDGVYAAARAGGYAGEAVTSGRAECGGDDDARPFEGPGDFVAMLVRPAGGRVSRGGRRSQTWRETNRDDGGVAEMSFWLDAPKSFAITGTVMIGAPARWPHRCFGLGGSKGVTAAGAR